jgi:glutamate-1-semialdehyde aminotransferase
LAKNFFNDTDLIQDWWIVDYQEDFDFVQAIFREFSGLETLFRMKKFVVFSPRTLSSSLECRAISEKSSYSRTKIMDNNPMNRYSKSIEQLKRAELTIPLGSQTFSKSRTQYPVGISPLYAAKAKGSEIWDVDGNRYIDLVSALASVTLGYSDSGVEKAVKKQLKVGVSMSLPGILEAEVAELIVEMVPSVEMVRFGKNGTDATSAAIRLARAYTGRDHIIVCGYHGWQDWYIGSTTRDKGVPGLVSSLTHKFEFNSINSLEIVLREYEGKVAAVIMEPMNVTYPEPGFLENVKKMTHDAGALLVFDETITGFRYAKGGAQDLFGVVPDLSTFGKGLANGFPLSAVGGRREIMMEMEEIFFSGTFGGELLSLAAAKYVLQRHLSEDICGKLQSIGQELSSKTELAVTHNKLQDVLKVSGHATWKFLQWSATEEFSADEIKTYFMQEVFRKGVLVLSTHNVTLAHTPKVIDQIMDTYNSTFEKLQKVLGNGALRKELSVPPLKPLFKVR